MSRSLLRLLPLLAFLPSPLLGQTNGPGWLPKPSSFTRLEGSLPIRSGMPVTFSPQDGELYRLASLMTEYVREAGGPATHLPVASPSSVSPGALHLHIDPQRRSSPEAYTLQITSRGMVLSARAYAGIFRGLQTFRQLLQDASPASGDGPMRLPAMSIVDSPRLGWRGLMVDVARHFFGKEVMKKVIDEMARYKLNVLHLHLSDDEGWRIQIRSFPKLTSVGAWRPGRVGVFNEISPAMPGEAADYGGYYTQEDIRELVAYARQRYIDILPEIDVPGHSLAAIVSYPQLSCTPEASEYGIRVGEPIRRWTKGRPISFVDNTLCPANELVYAFMDSVIREVSELFPFEYMHIGGDECAWNFWEKSDAVKRLMKEKGLGDMAAVQAYFVQRVSAIVTSRGKKTIGWDEIADDSASKGTTIMAWREMEAGLRSAKAGFPVILTPRSQYYLDYMQGDPVLEQPGPGVIRLRNVYNLDPFSSGIDPARLVGVQANLWTEHTLTQSRLEYQLWPRALAVAETGWYGKDSSGWVDFCRRVEARFRDMDLRNVRHAPSLYDPIVTVRRDDNDAITVALETEAPGLKIHYSFDFSHPDASYPVYSGPLRIPKDASMLKLVTSRDGKLIGRQLDLPVEALRQRAKFPFTLWQRVTSPTYLRRWIFLLAMLLMATLAWVVRLRRTSPPRRISE